jgi:HAD superfamily 5'-nucleotidase-like hydrolase
MDTHGRIGRVFHGTKRVPQAEVERLYKASKLRPSSNSFASIDTLFSMPEACLYANLVDFFEARLADAKSTAPIAIPPNLRKANEAAARDLSYAAQETSLLSSINTWKLFDDVRTAIDDIHRDGTLKDIIMADLAKYFIVDERLPLTLHKLRSAGKKLFLLTNSGWIYTNAVMSHVLSPPNANNGGAGLKEYASWRQYFDVIIVAGRKPRFFTDREPFLEVLPEETSEQVIGEAAGDRFERNKVYQGGNIEAFERMAQATGEEILYVGDHIFGDILKSRKDSRWRTCLIVEELADEIKGTIESRPLIERLTQLDIERHQHDDAISQQRALLAEIDAAMADKRLSERPLRLAEEASKRLKKEIDVAKRALRALKSNNELSRFGAQVSLYACTYTSKVSNLTAYSPVHFFRAPRELMSHDRAQYWGTLAARAPSNGSASR